MSSNCLRLDLLSVMTAWLRQCGGVARSLRAIGTIAACLVLSAWIAPATEPPGQTPQPDTIYELVYAFNYTFTNILTGHERMQLQQMSPDELKEVAPETYEKVSQNVVRWTDEWIAYIAHTLEMVPPDRLAAARREAEVVNAVLGEYFEARGSPYRALDVVFLPQRVFHDTRNKGYQTRGIVIPFYPGALFASVDSSSPMDHVLVHETIHFNKRGRRFGTRLSEGITEAATRQIVRALPALTQAARRRDEFYVEERKRIDVILNEMAKRADLSRESALELLLEAYMTGNQEGMYSIFGEAPWERVIELSKSRRWYKKDILKALREIQVSGE